MSASVYRPLAQTGRVVPDGALPLVGGPLWFDRVAEHRRGAPVRLIHVADVPEPVRKRLTAARPPMLGLDWTRPRVMGVLNVTPDSFSDGGVYLARDVARAQGHALLKAGADILDIGGESTRPGADPVSVDAEMERVVPVIEALRADGVTAPISIDTRRAKVAEAAFAAGADFLNDVSALSHDPDSPALAASAGVPVCLMHAQGDPKTMQDAPAYDDVLIDVYEYLAKRVAAAEAAGIDRTRILVDPGIGFGKTVAHNLALIRGLTALHGLGCAILFGASRKRFIGTLGDEPNAAAREPGSIAAMLEALRRGAQVVRVHDVKETRQAMAVWTAVNGFAIEE